MKAVCLVEVYDVSTCNCGSCQFTAGLRRKWGSPRKKKPYAPKKGGHRKMPTTRYTTENFQHLAKGRRLEIFERDRGVCRECGSGDWLTIDHIKPRSKGGTNAPSNLQTLCYDCNHLKADRYEERLEEKAS